MFTNIAIIIRDNIFIDFSEDKRGRFSTHLGKKKKKKEKEWVKNTLL